MAEEEGSINEETPQLVMDANILLREALGSRVQGLIKKYKDSVAFYAPDICMVDARKYAGQIAIARGLDPEPGLAVLNQLSEILEIFDRSLYEDLEAAARLRIAARDPDDWPIVATALMLGCPIWTEDQDFFGSGVAMWTTRHVEIYLRGQ